MLHQLIHWPDQFDKANWPFARTCNVGITYLELPTDRHRLKYYGNQIYGSQFPTTMSSLGITVLRPRPSLTRWKANTEIYKAFATWNVHGTVESTFFVCRSVLNLQTGNAHPYHVIHDEQFTSVHGTVSEELFNAEEWNSLIKLEPTG
jgi:hypothetical protein